MVADITHPVFADEAQARQYLEGIRWPDGPVCPHCGALDSAHKIKGESMNVRPGLYRCGDCKKQYTVTVGTVFERSKLPLHKWLLASYLLCSSKKGISSHQLHRMLGVTYKTAWFMTHRLREAMRKGKAAMGGFGGPGRIVEADETYIGGKEKNKHRSKRHSGVGGVGKEIVVSLVERGGSVRSHHVPAVSARSLRPILVAQVDRRSFLSTDDAGQWRILGREFARHESVNHGIEEYVRGDAHTNTVEGYFSLLKRGLVGIYHHVSQQHLRRYLGEFDFRYNTRDASDPERMVEVLRGIGGKRLFYRTGALA